MSAIRTTSKLILAYAEAEPEPWQQEHDLAMACRDLEEYMAWGVRLFRILAEIEGETQNEAIQGSRGNTDPVWKSLAENYKRLLGVFERIDLVIQDFKRRGLVVDGPEEFFQTLEEARCVIGSLELEAELPPIEELLPRLNSVNPRPERYGD